MRCVVSPPSGVDAGDTVAAVTPPVPTASGAQLPAAIFLRLGAACLLPQASGLVVWRLPAASPYRRCRQQNFPKRRDNGWLPGAAHPPGTHCDRAGQAGRPGSPGDKICTISIALTSGGKVDSCRYKHANQPESLLGCRLSINISHGFRAGVFRLRNMTQGSKVFSMSRATAATSWLRRGMVWPAAIVVVSS